MPVVVPVKFAFAAQELWFDPCGKDILEGDHAICSTERGTEIGLVTADPFKVTKGELAAPLKPVLRIATDDDLDYADELAQRGDDAMRDFRRLVEQNDLDMKPVAVEYLFGGEKAVFYFAAEDRVDFRQLVRDLSSTFHVRVDMRQIGVRDETRLVGGYATCGQELCCTRFGGEFEPVSIRMAKEQDLPLNSSKISGVCGRLMCCLRYEFEAYKDFKSRAPKKKAVIDTPLGKARVQEYNTPREELVLRLESGKVFKVNLADMTCSEGCKKKAKEQGCACRPDCVTRDVLERIESPDIALALMEIDRKHGVDVGDGLDRADRIAASGPTPRRRRQREEEAEKFESTGRKRSGGSQGKKKGEEAASQPRRRRRRADAPEDGSSSRRTATPQREASSGQGAPQQSRRRRRHMSAQDRDDAFLAAARAEQASGEGKATQAQGQPRRRHRSSAASNQSASQKPETMSVADQLAQSEVRVTRRRPGDGGGFGGSAKPANASGQKRSREDGAEMQRKRRRRRSRKPRQDGGADALPPATSDKPSA